MSLSLGLGLSITSRGGGVSPATILGASLLAWWTADRADLITLNGTSVTSWKDVTNGYDAVQGVSAARPVYSATAFNGAPGITFDGVDDQLTLASQPFPSAADESELWAIMQQDALVADTGTRVVFSYGGTTSTTQRRSRRNVVTGVNRGQLFIGNGAGAITVSEPSIDISSRHVIRGKVAATTSSISVDESALASGAVVPSTGTTRARIGASANDTAVDFWNGKIRDILVTGPLTADQVTALQAWALPRRML